MFTHLLPVGQVLTGKLLGRQTDLAIASLQLPSGLPEQEAVKGGQGIGADPLEKGRFFPREDALAMEGLGVFLAGLDQDDFLRQFFDTGLVAIINLFQALPDRAALGSERFERLVKLIAYALIEPQHLGVDFTQQFFGRLVIACLSLGRLVEGGGQFFPALRQVLGRLVDALGQGILVFSEARQGVLSGGDEGGLEVAEKLLQNGQTVFCAQK